jgi:hypothetical protein
LKKEMKIPQFFTIYRPRQTSEGMIELSVRHPSIFIKLKIKLANNKFWKQQFFRVSGEWEYPEGAILLKNRRMPRTWQLLRPDRGELPSISVFDREDIMKISEWSAARVKVEKFEEIDFDNLVTEENLRQFLVYNILRNKKMITKRRAAKKRSDASRPPRPATKKRPSERVEATPEDVPLRKKQNIPLAASGEKKTLPRRPAAETIVEEGSVSFRGFVPEVSPARGTGHSPPFSLRDETSFEASHRGSDAHNEEVNLGESVTASPASTRSEGEGELRPEASPVPAARRVKHVVKRKKFGPRDRLAEIISEVEWMWGRPVIRPSEVRQESAFSGEESPGDDDEDVATPNIKLLLKRYTRSTHLGLLQQSGQELPHPRTTTATWSVPHLRGLIQLPNRPKYLKGEYQKGLTPWDQRSPH